MGAAVTLVEENTGEPGGAMQDMLPEGSADPEGALTANGLQGWMPAQIAQKGWAPAKPVYVLSEDPSLNGIVPGADPTYYFLFGGSFFFLSFLTLCMLVHQKLRLAERGRRA